MGNAAADRRSALGLFPGQPRPRLYDRVVEALRSRHYSTAPRRLTSTGFAASSCFKMVTHPRELAAGDVNRFLTHLVMERKVAASTQNQALAAVLFLYEHVLEQALMWIEGSRRK